MQPTASSLLCLDHIVHRMGMRPAVIKCVTYQQSRQTCTKPVHQAYLYE